MFPPPGRYMMLRLFDSVCAISFAASMRRSSTSAGLFFVACEMSFAASDSPSARMTAARRSCSARKTTNLERSASC